MLGLGVHGAEKHAAWQYERYADPMHKGGAIVAAQQNASGLTAIVRCWSATEDLDIRFALSNGSMFAEDDVSWRFDAGPIRKGHWRRSPDGTALVAPETSEPELIRGMRAAKQMTLTAYSTERTAFVISLAGSAQPLADVQRACTVANRAGR